MVPHSIRIPQADYETLVKEAKRSRKSVADLFHDLIMYGLSALPPVHERFEAVQEAWANLGPPPTILYDKLEVD